MSIYPKYMKSIKTGAIFKFVSAKEGVVVDTGNFHKYTRGEIRSGLAPHTEQSVWENVSDIWLQNNVKSFTESVESLTFFQTLHMENSSSTLTKVPNGYVMTSHSGHQIFIKENTKETL